jgi:hypothetical protein
LKGRVTFGGRLDTTTPGPIARLLEHAGLARDYRDFSAIRMWAEEIACEAALKAVPGRHDAGTSGEVPAGFSS